MNYQDDFYNISNLIGKTEAPGQLPSFYFAKHVNRRTQFGHITQDHSNPNNIGRELIQSHKDYSMRLNPDNGTLQECIRGHVFRQSRNMFQTINLNTCSNDQKFEVLQALNDFPCIKNSQAEEVNKSKQAVKDLAPPKKLVKAAPIFALYKFNNREKNLYNNNLTPNKIKREIQDFTN